MERKEQTGHICRWMALGIMTAIVIVGCTIVIGLFEWRDRSRMESRVAETYLGRKSIFYLNMGDRRTEVNHPASGITSFTYDALGNVLTKQTANLAKEGKFISYDYDHQRLTGQLPKSSGEQREVLLRWSQRLSEPYRSLHAP
mgnify:CR=1 FL=1